jgi:hypothetical protein
MRHQLRLELMPSVGNVILTSTLLHVHRHDPKNPAVLPWERGTSQNGLIGSIQVPVLSAWTRH